MPETVISVCGARTLYDVQKMTSRLVMLDDAVLMMSAASSSSSAWWSDVSILMLVCSSLHGMPQHICCALLAAGKI
jgi:hypothetical protein